MSQAAQVSEHALTDGPIVLPWFSSWCPDVQTVIECLRYATTGETPKGPLASFINNPQV